MFYSLAPVWKSGDLEFPSIDNPAGLFECEDLIKTNSLRDSWEKPNLIPSEKADPIDLYFSVTENFAFSPAAVATLQELIGDSAEWLPVEIYGIGEYFFLNPLVAVSLGPDAQWEQNDVSKNIVEISKYNFVETDLTGHNVFRISQPPESSAGKAGFCFASIVVTEKFRSAWDAAKYKGLEFKALPAG